MAKAPAAPQKPQAGGKAPAGKAQQQPKRAAKGAAPAPATPQGRPKPTGERRTSSGELRTGRGRRPVRAGDVPALRPSPEWRCYASST